MHQASFGFLKNIEKVIKTKEDLILYIINQILYSYEHPINFLANKIDQLEHSIFLKGGSGLSIENLYFEKSKARLTKKILLITQTVINQFELSEEYASSHRDLKDSIVDLILRTEEIVEDSNSLLNSYMSYTAQKSNDVMKLLTVFSAFFLPLTFIAGIYGMNFKYMPELENHYGYFMVWASMILISVGIYIWFKKKGIL